MNPAVPGQRHRVTRRGALLAGVASASGPLGCRSGVRTPSQAGSGNGAPPDPWSGLAMATAGPMRADETGGVAVVLLHGWGAAGDDLVPLAQALARPRTRFFIPAAPLPEVGGGRAWWHLNAADRPAHAHDDQPPAGYQPHRHVTAARAAVQTVLRTITQRHRPDALVLAGFSQGAMLSLDVALAGTPAVNRIAALSGVLLADSLPALRAARPPRPAVLVSHGREDEILPFKGGQRAKDLLEKHGYHVTWRPFDGGHEIPPAVVDDLRAFLFAGA